MATDTEFIASADATLGAIGAALDDALGDSDVDLDWKWSRLERERHQQSQSRERYDDGEGCTLHG